jgi:hypothetical protein
MCVFAVVSATAWADPSALDKLAGQRAQLVAKFQSETDQVDRLKKEKASWRRDRELRQAMADSADTANQLAALDKQIAKLRPVKAPKKIVIPDGSLDPLADPEDLDKQAADLRAAEAELAGQAKGLDVQAKDLADVADLRKHHERAIDMSRRDDDQPLRTAQHSTTTATDNPQFGGPSNGGGVGTGGGGGAGSPAPGGGTGGGGGGGAGSGSGGSPGGSTGTDSFSGTDRSPTASSFESEASVVLGDVLDHATIDGLARASRSGDPGQRADAAKKAASAVRARAAALAKQRAAIEARAKQLRTH